MKKGLSNRRGEVFTATAVKVIIAVVVGVLILGGLFALYRNVIFPKLNQKVEGMIHTEDTVQVRKDGNSVQYRDEICRKTRKGDHKPCDTNYRNILN